VWDKASGTGFSAMRTMVTFADYGSAAKRRKLD
jgi:hypothetical protein